MTGDEIMVCFAYPVFVAMGALMLAHGHELVGVSQIAVGLGLSGARILRMGRGQAEDVAKRYPGRRVAP